MGNSATLFGYTKCVAICFNFASFVIRLALHLFTPPLGVLSIGIRAYAPDNRFNHLGVRSWLANLVLHLHTCLHTFMDYLAPRMFDVSNIDM